IPILVYETTILVLVFKLSIQYQRNRKEWSSNLLELLLKHMFFYFAFIFTLYISNAVLFANPDVRSIQGILTPIIVVLLSVLGNRMILNLREENKWANAGILSQEGENTRPNSIAQVGTAGIGLESRMRFNLGAEQSQFSQSYTVTEPA
ncbi:hypothetical protein BDP27DRAFT_1207742, partial [Rhodocollybia butyracea]